MNGEKSGYIEQQQMQHVLLLFPGHLAPELGTQLLGNSVQEDPAAAEDRAKLLPPWLGSRTHTSVGSSG